MTQVNTLRPIPFYAMGGNNPEEPKSLFAVLPFTLGNTQWQGDLLQQLQQKKFQGWRSTYFDTLDCANPVTLFFPTTQQRIQLPARDCGYLPVVVSDQMFFEVTGTADDTFRIHLLNVDIDPVVINGGSSGPIVPANITVSASPRLIGRYSPGAGPAEEISLSSPFVLGGGVFGAQASSQYNVMGRRTAGAGLYEDSSRQQLNIAGVDLANTFTQPQIILDPGFTGYPLTLQSNNPGAVGALLKCYHNSASPVVTDIPGGWEADFNNSLGVRKSGGSNAAVIVSAVSGSEATRQSFATMVAGVYAERLSLGAGDYSAGATGGDQGLNTANRSNYFANGFRVANFAGLTQSRQFTVGTLPASAGVTGSTAFVTDATVATFGVAPTGGGALTVPVYAAAGIWVMG